MSHISSNKSMVDSQQLKKKSDQPKAWKVSMAGTMANLASQVLYPLENLKIRFQANNNTTANPIPAYRGIWNGLSSIYKQEGLGAMYRGVSLSIFAGSVANSIFFYVYADGKKRYDFDPN